MQRDHVMFVFANIYVEGEDGQKKRVAKRGDWVRREGVPGIPASSDEDAIPAREPYITIECHGESGYISAPMRSLSTMYTYDRACNPDTLYLCVDIPAAKGLENISLLCPMTGDVQKVHWRVLAAYLRRSSKKQADLLRALPRAIFCFRNGEWEQKA